VPGERRQALCVRLLMTLPNSREGIEVDTCATDGPQECIDRCPNNSKGRRLQHVEHRCPLLEAATSLACASLCSFKVARCDTKLDVLEHRASSCHPTRAHRKNLEAGVSQGGGKGALAPPRDVIGRLVPCVFPMRPAIAKRNADREIAARAQEPCALPQQHTWLIDVLEDLECGDDIKELTRSVLPKVVESPSVNIVYAEAVVRNPYCFLIEVDPRHGKASLLRSGKEVSDPTSHVQQSADRDPPVSQKLSMIPADGRRVRQVAQTIRVGIPIRTRTVHWIEEVQVAGITGVERISS
jgi:hypothetical protein